MKRPSPLPRCGQNSPARRAPPRDRGDQGAQIVFVRRRAEIGLDQPGAALPVFGRRRLLKGGDRRLGRVKVSMIMSETARAVRSSQARRMTWAALLGGRPSSIRGA